MYKYGKSCIKKLLYCMAICIAILAVSIGVMWGLSSDYKLYGVPVLNYHQINDEKHSALTLHVDQFKEQMEYLHNHGYNTITLNQLYDYLQNGSDLPEKPIVITFDDGYVDNYEHAHTNHHKILTHMDPTELPDAILGGKTSMEGILGEPINYLAYPGGFNDMLVQYVTKQSGYKMAFTVQPGTVKPGDNLYALNRLAVFQGDTPYLSFWLRLHCAPLIKYTWALRDTLRDNGWTILASIVPLL
ncbi:MAG: polysaccharide deacetylase family protein [Veillonella sp.]|nr:polysaccharide deacetylase family protein [Veillonella sp.]